MKQERSNAVTFCNAINTGDERSKLTEYLYIFWQYLNLVTPKICLVLVAYRKS